MHATVHLHCQLFQIGWASLLSIGKNSEPRRLSDCLSFSSQLGIICDFFGFDRKIVKSIMAADTLIHWTDRHGSASGSHARFNHGGLFIELHVPHEL